MQNGGISMLAQAVDFQAEADELQTVARHDGWPASDTRMAGRCASLRWPD
jgi:hypothetical protein